MTSSSRPPAGLEFKASAAVLAPTGPAAPASRRGPGATAVTDNGEITGLAAVTGVIDEVGDELVPGCFRRSLAARTPRLCVAHDWGRVAGKALECVELMPGDPRLPRTTPRGEPWPPAAGALFIRAAFLPTREGQEARAVAQAFGTDTGLSIGYKTRVARQRGRVRELHDVDLFECSTVIFGANTLATVLSVKSGRPRGLEHKATSGTAGRRRDGTPVVVDCSMCGRPAAAVLPGGLGPDESVICAACMDGATDAATLDEAGAPAATISADDLMGAALLELPELTSEEEYAAALAAEQRYELDPDGTLTEVDGDQAGTEGYAWRRADRGTGWGTP